MNYKNLHTAYNVIAFIISIIVLSAPALAAPIVQITNTTVTIFSPVDGAVFYLPTESSAINIPVIGQGSYDYSMKPDGSGNNNVTIVATHKLTGPVPGLLQYPFNYVVDKDITGTQTATYGFLTLLGVGTYTETDTFTVDQLFTVVDLNGVNYGSASASSTFSIVAEPGTVMLMSLGLVAILFLASAWAVEFVRDSSSTF